MIENQSLTENQRRIRNYAVFTGENSTILSCEFSKYFLRDGFCVGSASAVAEDIFFIKGDLRVSMRSIPPSALINVVLLEILNSDGVVIDDALIEADIEEGDNEKDKCIFFYWSPNIKNGTSIKCTSFQEAFLAAEKFLMDKYLSFDD